MYDVSSCSSFRAFVVGTAVAILSVTYSGIAAPETASSAGKQGWIIQSNAFSANILNVQMEHTPEQGSQEGLSSFDNRISDPRLADDLAQRRELRSDLKRLYAADGSVTDSRVRQDLEILQQALVRQFKMEDFAEQHLLTVYDPSELIFQGIKTLLDDAVDAARYPAALIRLTKYVGEDGGSASFTKLLEQRERVQRKKLGVIYPAKALLTDQLKRNSQYVEGIALLFQKYKLVGWESTYAKLRLQLRHYDSWVISEIMPHARSDFRQAPEQYALSLEQNGVDPSPDQLAGLAHAAFIRDKAEIATLAVQVALAHGLKSEKYPDVIRELKKDQLAGEDMLSLYRTRLRDIESIITRQHLVSLPHREAVIRVATAAETAQNPAPHSTEPPLLMNSGLGSEFVLPVNHQSFAAGINGYDDFTFDAAAWALTAHEARPGHELQYDSMLEGAVSIARMRFASNSTNDEGWALYCEFLMQPFEPVDGQLITLQFRLLRDARASLDPELQSGKIDPLQAMDLLETEVAISHALAAEEIDRYTVQSPGQAVSYFYGYTLMRALRDETEKTLGRRFDQRKFHDFVIAQGGLPLKLIRQAVMRDFIPSQR